MPRFDFGTSLRITRCVTCNAVTRNQGCQVTQRVYCKQCFQDHAVACSHCMPGLASVADSSVVAAEVPEHEEWPRSVSDPSVIRKGSPWKRLCSDESWQLANGRGESPRTAAKAAGDMGPPQLLPMPPLPPSASSASMRGRAAFGSTPRGFSASPAPEPVPALIQVTDFIGEPAPGGALAVGPRQKPGIDSAETLARIDALEAVTIGQQKQLERLIGLHQAQIEDGLAERQLQVRELEELWSVTESMRSDFATLLQCLQDLACVQIPALGRTTIAASEQLGMLGAALFASDAAAEAILSAAGMNAMAALRSCSTGLKAAVCESAFYEHKRMRRSSSRERLLADALHPPHMKEQPKGCPSRSPAPRPTPSRRSRTSLPERFTRSAHDIFAIGGCSHDAGEVQASTIAQRLRVSASGTCTSSWETLPGMAVARQGHRIAFHDGFLYVVGGRNDSAALSSCERFSVERARWEVLPALQNARSAHSLAVFGTSLVAVGGLLDDGQSTASCECMSLPAGPWLAGPSLATPRQSHQSVLSERLLIAVGGYCHGADVELTCEYLTRGEGEMKCWEPCPALPKLADAKPTRLQAAALGDDLYIVMTVEGAKSPPPLYRLSGSTWELLPRPMLIHHCEVVVDVGDRLLIFGRLSHHRHVGVCQCFNPCVGQWEHVPPLQLERTSCEVAAIAGCVYVFGGSSRQEEDDSMDAESFVPSSTVAYADDSHAP
eukprot:TRINITY_DN67073_c0_g1_i2.p1 TRINITY_DN67073_c0_g1~~TRINITY_DN67073_c0_g1_i2.p1  ORF type:complete len:720 (+),score=89.03 TRINITY_DN67073_c0_g1_i2:67-2226(+)